MNNLDTAEGDRAAIMRTSAELLSAVNASDANRCLAVWADHGMLMPPNHRSVQGREALDEYFRSLFSLSRFRFTFTSSQIQLAGDIALERVTYMVVVWPGTGGSPVEDFGKGLHVYGRQSNGSWKLTQDIWSSDQPC